MLSAGSSKKTLSQALLHHRSALPEQGYSQKAWAQRGSTKRNTESKVVPILPICKSPGSYTMQMKINTLPFTSLAPNLSQDTVCHIQVHFSTCNITSACPQRFLKAGGPTFTIHQLSWGKPHNRAPFPAPPITCFFSFSKNTQHLL